MRMAWMVYILESYELFTLEIAPGQQVRKQVQNYASMRGRMEAFSKRKWFCSEECKTHTTSDWVFPANLEKSVSNEPDCGAGVERK